MSIRFYSSPEEGCLAVNVDFNGILPECGKNRRLNVSCDFRGMGDANIYVFPDGNGGCVTNFKSGQRAYWYAPSKSTICDRTRHDKTEIYDPNLWVLWDQAKPVSEHPYLINKCIKSNKRIRQISHQKIQNIFNWAPWGLRDPLLCVPLIDGAGLVSMQFIDIEGQKRFLKGHKTTGAYWSTGKAKPNKPIGIAEGVATAISVAAVNKFPVVAAMSCGNLVVIAKKIRARFPDKQIYLLSDADKGEINAQIAAKIISAGIAIPPFTADMLRLFQEGKPSDFNDYYRILGILK